MLLQNTTILCEGHVSSCYNEILPPFSPNSVQYNHPRSEQNGMKWNHSQSALRTYSWQMILMTSDQFISYKIPLMDLKNTCFVRMMRMHNTTSQSLSIMHCVNYWYLSFIHCSSGQQPLKNMGTTVFWN